MTWLKKILLVAALVTPFALIEASANFVDPDSYFHAKLTDLILHGGLVTDFPWLPFTTLAHNFADQHLLYHLLLLPFVGAFGPLVGIKVAAAAFAATLFLTLAWCLRVWGGRHAPWLVLLAFTSGTLIFRVAIPKAGPLAVAVVLLLLTTLRGRRLWPLFILAFAHVWLHGSWPLAIIFGGLNALVSLAFAGHPRRWLTDMRVRLSVAQAAVIAAGCAAGLVVNPYFPGNLAFYWEQIFQVAVVGYAATVNVGVEWLPYGWRSLMAENGGLWLGLNMLVVIGIYAKAAGAWQASKQDEAARHVAMAATAAALLLLMTIRQQRHLEFLMPVLLLTMASLAEWYHQSIKWSVIKADFLKAMPAANKVIVAVGAYLLIACCWLITAGLVEVTRLNHNPQNDWTAAAGMGEWLATEVAPGTVIYHDNWSDFPRLFFFAVQGRGIAGVDPVFLYRRNPAAYRQWESIALGQTRQPSTDALVAFGAEYLLVRNSNKALTDALLKEGTADLVYSDTFYQIYRRR